MKNLDNTYMSVVVGSRIMRFNLLREGIGVERVLLDIEKSLKLNDDILEDILEWFNEMLAAACEESSKNGKHQKILHLSNIAANSDKMAYTIETHIKDFCRQNDIFFYKLKPSDPDFLIDIW